MFNLKLCTIETLNVLTVNGFEKAAMGLSSSINKYFTVQSRELYAKYLRYSFSSWSGEIKPPALLPFSMSIIQKRVQHPLFSLGPQGSCQQGRSTQLTGPEWPLEVQTHPETKHLAYQPRLTLQVSSSFVSR